MVISMKRAMIAIGLETFPTSSFLVEIQFMGLVFAAWRFVLTLGALTITGLIMQRIIGAKKKEA
jgi:hypothetical protein